MKNKLALFCAAGLCAGTAHAQSSVALYGLVDAGVTYASKIADASGNSSGQWSMHPSAMQGSRLGVRGNEDLGGGLRALFVLEGGINMDTGASSQGGLTWGRRSVVGLEGPWGTLLAGRQPDFLDDMGTMTSVIDFGSQVSQIHGLDRTGTQRTNSSLRYNSKSLGGLRFSAIHGFGQGGDSAKVGTSQGLGADYTQGKLRVAAAYYMTRVASGAAATAADAGYSGIAALPGSGGVVGSPGDVALRTFTLASTYQWGATRLHASYSQYEQPLAVAGGARSLRSVSNRRTGILDVGFSHALTPTTFLSASVIHDRVRFVGAPSGSLTQYNVGLDHFLSKRTDVYVNLGQQSSSNMTTAGLERAPGGTQSQWLARVGVRHKF